MNTDVLETSYISFLRYKRHRRRAPDVLTNRQSRFMAYRQFFCWVRKGQPLVKKYRVTLPVCVLKTIREEFPSSDGNYEGFKTGLRQTVLKLGLSVMQSLGSNWLSNNENSWQHRHSDGKGSEMHFEHEHQFVSFWRGLFSISRRWAIAASYHYLNSRCS
jgi:hypothetical protein